MRHSLENLQTGDVSLSVNKHCGRASGEEMVYPSRHERKIEVVQLLASKRDVVGESNHQRSVVALFPTFFRQYRDSL